MGTDFNKISDTDLYEMCIRWEQPAWAYVYNFIINIIRMKQINLKQEPHDIAHDIVEKLLDGGIKKVREKNKFRNYLKKATANRTIDASRKAMEKKEESMDKPVEGEEGEKMEQIYAAEDCSPEEQAIRKNKLEVIEKAIDSLPMNCRKLLKEYFKYKLGFYRDYSELTQVLNKPKGTISVEVGRCIKTLRQNSNLRELVGG